MQHSARASVLHLCNLPFRKNAPVATTVPRRQSSSRFPQIQSPALRNNTPPAASSTFDSCVRTLPHPYRGFHSSRKPRDYRHSYFRSAPLRLHQQGSTTSYDERLMRVAAVIDERLRRHCCCGKPLSTPKYPDAQHLSLWTS
jgi:hypothetical protein